MKKYFQTVFVILCFTVLNISCSDDDKNDVDKGKVEKPDFSKKIKSSVSGFVTNEQNEPVSNAVVKSGDKLASTDENGYFEITNVDVVKNMGVVTVETPNYFKGIRTWVADTNTEEFVRIKLISKNVIGTFDAKNGGKIKLSNGLTLNFPADVIVNESTGQAYTGNVNVAMYWINPVGEYFSQEMPGDLSAINNEGYLQTLVSYGMVAAELSGQSNEKLQISKGKSVSFIAPIEQEQLSSAPNSMPLWLFNEANGLWEERGIATKEGNNYVGKFDHFSYWNFDMPHTPCIVKVKFVDKDDNPVQNLEVMIEGTYMGQKYISNSYTNKNGVAQLRSVANTSGKIHLNYNSCRRLYSQAINTNDGTLDLGTIKVTNLDDGVIEITGTVVDCDNKPVNGKIIYKTNECNNAISINNGKYKIKVYTCDVTNPLISSLTLKAYDFETLKSTIVTETNITNNIVKNLVICEDNVNTDTYIKFEVGSEKYVIIGKKYEFDNTWNTNSYFWRDIDGIPYVRINYSDNYQSVQINWKEQNIVPTLGTYTGYASISIPDSNFFGNGTVSITKYLIPVENTYDVKGTFYATSDDGTVAKGEFAFKGKSQLPS